MSPFVRGRAIGQVESSGQKKKTYDILLWTEQLKRKSFWLLNTLQQLREYLGTITPQTVRINVWLPEAFGQVHSLLNTFGVPVSAISAGTPNEDIMKIFAGDPQPGMREAAATALSCDADLVVTENSDWYPYFKEFEDLNVLLGSPETILRQAEIFVCGHDLPWSFRFPMFDAPWGPFYIFAENRTLNPGLVFLDACRRKGIDPSVQEIGRSFLYNRIPNMLFTRDRLLFYEMQQAAAKRARWQRQKFQFEIGYHLNFYYILLYGGFDHLAVLINGVLGLGLPVREVAATGKSFLKELQKKAPEIHALFTDPDIEEFMERIASLRHSSAHRSQIMPAPVYEAPEHEPTVAELDEEIKAKGLDADLRFVPEGAIREGIRETIRFKVKLSKYKMILEDAVLLDTKKKKGLINPLVDTEWNFCKFHTFFAAVLDACAKLL